MAGNSSAIRAGRAFVELLADDSKLQAGLRKAQARLRAWGAAITATGARVLAGGLGLKGAFDAFEALFARTGSEMLHFARETGLSVEEVSALDYAAGQAGVSMEELEHGIRHMQTTLAGAAAGSHEDILKLAKLGAPLGEFAGKGTFDQLRLFAEAISKLPPGARQTAAAVETFGRAGARLLPYLQQGAKGIDAFMGEAKELGLIMSTEDAVAADTWRREITSLLAQLKKIGFEIGSVVAPITRDLVKAIRPNITAAIEWVRENKGLILSAVKLATAVVTLGAGIIAVGMAFKVASVGIGIVGSLIHLLLNPLFLIPALLVGAAAAVVYFSDSWEGIKETALLAWGGIVDALKSGDLVLAGKIAMIGLEAVVTQAAGAIEGVWYDMLHALTDGWVSAIFFLKHSWRAFTTDIEVQLVDLYADIKEKLGGEKIGADVRERAKRILREKAAREEKAEGEAFFDQIQANRMVREQHQKELDERLAAARKELEDLREEAAQGDLVRRFNAGRRPDEAKLAKFNPTDFIAGKVEVMGTFNAMLANRMGIGQTAADRTAVATEKTEVNTRKIVEALVGAGGIGAGVGF